MYEATRVCAELLAQEYIGDAYEYFEERCIISVALPRNVAVYHFRDHSILIVKRNPGLKRIRLYDMHSKHDGTDVSDKLAEVCGGLAAAQGALAALIKAINKCEVFS